MADELTVSMEALQWHTLQGTAYNVGDTYTTDEGTAASLVVQGKAKRVDTAAPMPSKRASHPVEPMKLESVGEAVPPAAPTPPTPPKARTARAPKPAKAAKVKASKPAERRKVTKPLRKAKIRGTAARKR